MPTRDPATVPLETAVEALAARAVELRQGAPAMDKQALEKTVLLEGLGRWYQGLSPAQQKLLIGGGAGAGLGLASSLLQNREDRHPVSSTITGGLAGGALGLGLGMAQQAGPNAPAPGKVSPAESVLKKIEDLKGRSQLGPVEQVLSDTVRSPAVQVGAGLGLAGAGGAAAEIGSRTVHGSQAYHPDVLTRGLLGDAKVVEKIIDPDLRTALARSPSSLLGKLLEEAKAGRTSTIPVAGKPAQVLRPEQVQRLLRMGAESMYADPKTMPAGGPWLRQGFFSRLFRQKNPRLRAVGNRFGGAKPAMGWGLGIPAVTAGLDYLADRYGQVQDARQALEQLGAEAAKATNQGAGG